MNFTTLRKQCQKCFGLFYKAPKFVSIHDMESVVTHASICSDRATILGKVLSEICSDGATFIGNMLSEICSDGATILMFWSVL
jgi:hypothetical protein